MLHSAGEKSFEPYASWLRGDSSPGEQSTTVGLTIGVKGGMSLDFQSEFQNPELIASFLIIVSPWAHISAHSAAGPSKMTK